MAASGPGADCRLCGLELGNAEVSPTHDTVVTDTSYVRTLISEASCKDFAPHYARLVILFDIDMGVVLAGVVLITHCPQAYVKAAGR